MKNVCFILAIGLFLSACTKRKTEEFDAGKDYYPTKTGRYIIYDVDSTVYSQLPKDTFIYKYRVKEILAGTFTDNQGKEAYRLERYIKRFNPLKSYDSIPWTIKEVWMVNVDDNFVQVVESNVRFTKLVFPIVGKKSWNGNAFNTLGEWQFKYDYINNAETINGTRFDNVLSVNQKYSDIKISLQDYQEKYAKGIGLVYRHIADVRSNAVTSTPILKRIESGIVFNQIFVSTGYE